MSTISTVNNENLIEIQTNAAGPSSIDKVREETLQLIKKLELLSNSGPNANKKLIDGYCHNLRRLSDFVSAKSSFFLLQKCNRALHDLEEKFQKITSTCTDSLLDNYHGVDDHESFYTSESVALNYEDSKRQFTESRRRNELISIAGKKTWTKKHGHHPVNVSRSNKVGQSVKRPKKPIVDINELERNIKKNSTFLDDMPFEKAEINWKSALENVVSLIDEDDIYIKNAKYSSPSKQVKQIFEMAKINSMQTTPDKDNASDLSIKSMDLGSDSSCIENEPTNIISNKQHLPNDVISKLESVPRDVITNLLVHEASIKTCLKNVQQTHEEEVWKRRFYENIVEEPIEERAGKPQSESLPLIIKHPQITPPAIHRRSLELKSKFQELINEKIAVGDSQAITPSLKQLKKDPRMPISSSVVHKLASNSELLTNRDERSLFSDGQVVTLPMKQLQKHLSRSRSPVGQKLIPTSGSLLNRDESFCKIEESFKNAIRQRTMNVNRTQLSIHESRTLPGCQTANFRPDNDTVSAKNPSSIHTLSNKERSIRSRSSSIVKYRSRSKTPLPVLDYPKSVHRRHSSSDTKGNFSKHTHSSNEKIVDIRSSSSRISRSTNKTLFSCSKHGSRLHRRHSSSDTTQEKCGHSIGSDDDKNCICAPQKFSPSYKIPKISKKVISRGATELEKGNVVHVQQALRGEKDSKTKISDVENKSNKKRYKRIKIMSDDEDVCSGTIASAAGGNIDEKDATISQHIEKNDLHIPQETEFLDNQNQGNKDLLELLESPESEPEINKPLNIATAGRRKKMEIVIKDFANASNFALMLDNKSELGIHEEVKSYTSPIVKTSKLDCENEVLSKSVESSNAEFKDNLEVFPQHSSVEDNKSSEATQGKEENIHVLDHKLLLCLQMYPRLREKLKFVNTTSENWLFHLTQSLENAEDVMIVLDEAKSHVAKKDHIPELAENNGDVVTETKDITLKFEENVITEDIESVMDTKNKSSKKDRARELDKLNEYICEMSRSKKNDIMTATSVVRSCRRSSHSGYETSSSFIDNDFYREYNSSDDEVFENRYRKRKTMKTNVKQRRPGRPKGRKDSIGCKKIKKSVRPRCTVSEYDIKDHRLKKSLLPHYTGPEFDAEDQHNKKSRLPQSIVSESDPDNQLCHKEKWEQRPAIVAEPTEDHLSCENNNDSLVRNVTISESTLHEHDISINRDNSAIAGSQDIMTHTDNHLDHVINENMKIVAIQSLDLMKEYKQVSSICMQLTKNPSTLENSHMPSICMKPCPRSVKLRLYGKDAVLCNEMEHQKQSKIQLAQAFEVTSYDNIENGSRDYAPKMAYSSQLEEAFSIVQADEVMAVHNDSFTLVRVNEIEGLGKDPSHKKNDSGTNSIKLDEFQKELNCRESDAGVNPNEVEVVQKLPSCQGNADFDTSEDGRIQKVSLQRKNGADFDVSESEEVRNQPSHKESDANVDVSEWVQKEPPCRECDADNVSEIKEFHKESLCKADGSGIEISKLEGVQKEPLVKKSDNGVAALKEGATEKIIIPVEENSNEELEDDSDWALFINDKEAEQTPLQLTKQNFPFRSVVRNLYRPQISEESCKKIVTINSYEEASKLTCPVISGLFKCGICEEYTTRVLKNMKCHMITHKAGFVFNKDIVNPIPKFKKLSPLSDNYTKLENKENNTATQQKQPQINNVEKKEPIYCVPDFVPLNLRFKCGSKTCNFYARDHGILKEHMKTVHPRMQRYNCPHCCSTITPDVVHLHLRYHKNQLFKCGLCDHLHYQRAGIEHHSKEKHPGEKCQIDVVRDLVTTGRKNIMDNGTRPNISIAAEALYSPPKSPSRINASKYFTCELCPGKYFASYEREQHEKETGCLRCDNIFKGICGLRKHLKETETTQCQSLTKRKVDFICEFCGMRISGNTIKTYERMIKHMVPFHVGKNGSVKTCTIILQIGKQKPRPMIDEEIEYLKSLDVEKNAPLATLLPAVEVK